MQRTSFGSVIAAALGLLMVFALIGLAPLSAQADIIQIIDSTGDGAGPSTRDLEAAGGIAVDGSGNVYVVGFRSHTIYKIAPADGKCVDGTTDVITEILYRQGDLVHTLRKKRPPSNGFCVFPLDVAVDCDENVYVTCTSNDNAFKIAAPLGTCETTRCVGGANDGNLCTGLSRPRDAPFDPQCGPGSFCGCTITEIIDAMLPEQCETLPCLKGVKGGCPLSCQNPILDNPISITTDSAGNVFLVGGDKGRGHAFKIKAPLGTCSTLTTFCDITEIIGSSGDGVGNLLQSARGVAVDGADNVYVTGITGRLAFPPREENVFKVETPIACGKPIPPGGPLPPCTITNIIDRFGDDVSGSVCNVTGSPASATCLENPFGIATDGSGNVFVAGSFFITNSAGSDNVFKIATPGTCSTNGTPCAIREIIDFDDGLDNPGRVAVDSSGNVYVAGRASNKVYKITPGDVISVIIDATGDGNGNTLLEPFGVAVDDLGNVYVTGLGSSNAFKITDQFPPGSPRCGGPPPEAGFEKKLTSGPDADDDGEIDLVIEIVQGSTTVYDFDLTYTSDGTPVLVVDTVPAEWIVTEIDGTAVNVDECGEADTVGSIEVFRAGQTGKKCKGSTKILWVPDPDSDSSTINVVVETRESPGSKLGKEKFAPTSCGALFLNSGPAQVFEIDETGEPLLDPETGEKLPPLFEAGPLCLAAVEDVDGDEVIVRDGSGDEDGDDMSDLEEACELGTDPCLDDTDGDLLGDGDEVEAGTDPLNPDTDGDGVLDGYDTHPLDPNSHSHLASLTELCPCQSSLDAQAYRLCLKDGYKEIKAGLKDHKKALKGIKRTVSRETYKAMLKAQKQRTKDARMERKALLRSACAGG